jgi:hypothetical protein
MVEQHHEDLERLFLQPNAQAVLAQFASAQVQFENPKPEMSANVMVFLHGK